jgi:hypothetical protein
VGLAEFGPPYYRWYFHHTLSVVCEDRRAPMGRDFDSFTLAPEY